METLIERLRIYHRNNPNSGFNFYDYHNNRSFFAASEREALYDENLNFLPLPATLEEVENAEQVLGFKLSLLLRELYLHFSNGGFGRGILGLANGWRGGMFPYPTTAVDEYIHYQQLCNNSETNASWEKLLKGRLPIAHGGCTIWYLLDCRTDNGAVIEWDAAGLGEEGMGIAATSLQKWLEYWLDMVENSKEQSWDDLDLKPDEIPF